MTIRPSGDSFTTQCDGCERVRAIKDADAMALAHALGWWTTPRGVGPGYQAEHYCPACARDERRATI